MAGNRQRGSDVGLREVIDLHRKINHVLKPIGVEINVLVTNIANDYYKKLKRTPASWFEKATPKDDNEVKSYVRYRVCEEIINTLREKYSIIFRDEWFSASYNDFSKDYESKIKPSEAKSSPSAAKNETYSDINARASAISGVYQIIRPYMMDNSRYVIEIMAITENGNGHCDLLMYSHNAPEPEYIYSGDLFIDNRYCSAIVRRTHEADNNRIINRNVLIHVDFEKKLGSYVSRAVYSGVILRGLKGKNGKKAGAIPFIAIKTNHDVSIMTNTLFGESTLNGIKQIAQCLLIGEVNKEHINMFSMCERIFSSLKNYISKDYALFTVDTSIIERIILENPRNKIGCYSAWERIVMQDLTENT